MKIGLISLAGIDDLDKEILDFDKMIKYNADYIVRYLDFSSNFPKDICKKITSYGRIPSLTWLPEIGDNRRECKPDETGISDILSGKYDIYIDNFAQDVKDFESTIYIDFLHELNAGWYTWSGAKNGGNISGVEKVVSTWKYVVKRFRDLNVNNVKWIWSVHEDNYNVPKDEWNNIKNYWPGDEWVDFIAIDGFNFYPKNPEREEVTFLTFYQCFNKMYKEVEALSSSPIMIMTGTAEFKHEDAVGNKALWIKHMFNDLNEHFPRIQSISWFNYKYSDDIDWKINSSESALKSWVDGFGNSKW